MPSPTIKNKNGPDYKCDSPIDTCLYESVFANGEVHEFSLSCKCGLTPTGAAFCPKVYKQDYTNLMQETLQRLSITGECHTLHRFDIYECLMMNV